MVVSLYTSRVILATLGVIDFGIWNVVAGVVAMFSFLNASMTGATSRFITFSLGKGNKDDIQNVFAGVLTIHLFIALLVFVLGETIGLWFLHNKLVIPESRFFAANIIYQISIIIAVIGIMQVPYNASIIAHEHMSVYAYVEILNTVLRLIIVYLLLVIPFDKLIIYACLLLSVAIIIFAIYKIYCSHKFEGCRFCLTKDKRILKPMLSFSGWDLYGNASVVARTQGVNMLLNMFFTVALNAASGIATQVQTAVMSFASNVLQAFKPQIVKSFAQGDNERMKTLINKAAQYTTLLLLLFTIPLCLEIDYVLNLWLRDVPEYASVLCRYTLIFNIFANLSSCVVSGIHATGNIKRPSLINGSLYLSVIPFAYIAYKNGALPQISYIFNVCAVFLGMLSNVYTLRLYVAEYKIETFLKDILLKCAVIASLSILLCYALKINMEESFLRLCTITIVNVFVILSSTFCIILSSGERSVIVKKLRNFLCKQKV